MLASIFFSLPLIDAGQCNVRGKLYDDGDEYSYTQGNAQCTPLCECRVSTLWAAQTLLKPCSNPAQICSKPAQTLLPPCSNPAQTLLKPCTNPALTLLKPCSNPAVLRHLYCSGHGCDACTVRSNLCCAAASSNRHSFGRGRFTIDTILLDRGFVFTFQLSSFQPSLLTQ